MKNFLIIFCVIITKITLAQQMMYSDFISIQTELEFEPISKKVEFKAKYTFKVLKDVDTVVLDAKNIYFFELYQSDFKARLSSKDEKIFIHGEGFKKDKTYSVTIIGFTYPKKALYFLDRNNDSQIWTQGQGKYTSNWLPSIDNVNDKIEFDLSITYKNDYEVISNGKLLNKDIGDSETVWNYDMQKPMSSYLVALAIGKYNKKTEISKSGIPLEYYYYPEDSLKAASTYRYSKRMFDFLEDEIGFAYPWQNYKQVPVHDFLYAGMENTSATIFSDAFVVDSIGFNDKSYVNVNAHELAHQWFGDLLTAKSGEHHWLQEGFATYYALLVERDIFGDDYYYFKLFESVLDLSRQDLIGKATSLVDAKSSSLTFYQRGAWVLHALRNKVGDIVFKDAVRNYLEKYQFNTVETTDFISEVERSYGRSLSAFVNLWIKAEAFPYEKALDLLKQQSAFINEYSMIDCETKSSKCAEYLKYSNKDEVKIKIISQRPELITTAVFNNSLKVRQAISQYLTEVPEDLKLEYESLLDDKSYVTVEKALYNLWTSFPSERSKYLSKTLNIEGFNDKSFRLLWLVLNLNTPFYQADNKQELYNELVNYTDAKYNAEVRMNAFQYLKLINSCNNTCKSNLEIAKTHHNWRLVKFSKEMFEKLEQNRN